MRNNIMKSLGYRVVYCGWIRGVLEDRRKWRMLGIRGKMSFRPSDDVFPYAAFEYCTASPQIMQKLLDEKLINNPMCWTAVWEGTDRQLSRNRQLWGGASVQL